MLNLTDEDFKTLVTFVHTNYGIDLSKKRTLIEGRLTNVIKDRNIASFHDYLDIVFKDKSGKEMTELLNRLTTNHTFFLREIEHFDYLRDVVLPYMEKTCKNHEIRIWSAASSSGQEAYTIAMVVAEYFGSKKSQWDTRILATDIALDMLAKGQQATYPEEALNDVPEDWQKKYFKKNGDGTVTLSEAIRNDVIFKPFNLMDPFPFKKPFDIIFCRNVMIYFDTPTKVNLVNKFYNVTRPGGYFFIGHSETISKSETKYTYLKPAMYRKEEGGGNAK